MPRWLKPKKDVEDGDTRRGVVNKWWSDEFRMEKSLVVKTARTAVSQGITNNQITSIPNKFQIQNYKNQTKNVWDLEIRKLDIVCFLVYWKLLFRVRSMGAVGERSWCGEGWPKGLLERQEVRIRAWVTNFRWESWTPKYPRFPQLRCSSAG